MTLPVVLRDEATAEFEEAFDYYEARRPGLGVDFTARVQEAFDRIAANPRLHAVVFADIRKAVVARFPYCVFYRAEAARVALRAQRSGERAQREGLSSTAARGAT